MEKQRSLRCKYPEIGIPYLWPFALFMGRKALTGHWPKIAHWIKRHSPAWSGHRHHASQRQ